MSPLSRPSRFRRIGLCVATGALAAATAAAPALAADPRPGVDPRLRQGVVQVEDLP
ncbi:hypothetical protein I3W98_35700, partial [Streptomyces cavourensis]|nr:hypothetical protein [Streptomyces cavourensis]